MNVTVYTYRTSTVDEIEKTETSGEKINFKYLIGLLHGVIKMVTIKKISFSDLRAY